jgi:hypothetical protein
MLTSTIAELLNAIEVLNKLGRQIKTSAADSVLQRLDAMPDDHSAGRTGAIALEQISRIEVVAGQLQSWRN